jgi:flagellar basal body-associated protein FliL
MAEKKNNDKKQMLFTFLMIALFIVMALAFMYMTGSLSGKSGEAMNIATSVCFLTGHVDGMEKIQRSGSGYAFNCSNENVTLTYNTESNNGYIEWPKG